MNGMNDEENTVRYAVITIEIQETNRNKKQKDGESQISSSFNWLQLASHVKFGVPIKRFSIRQENEFNLQQSSSIVHGTV
jgi:hypothetical protein